jgi:hypothetical protein
MDKINEKNLKPEKLNFETTNNENNEINEKNNEIINKNSGDDMYIYVHLLK